MSRDSQKTIKTLSAEIMRRFGGQLDRMGVIRVCWATVVGEPMAGHSEPTQYDGACLTVAVSSSAWASRMRQREASLVRELRGDPALKSLRELKIRIQPTKPTVTVAASPARRPSRISPNAARLVRAVAEAVGDPQLRAALERLGSAHDGDDVSKK